jgi:hypothetical protein
MNANRFGEIKLTWYGEPPRAACACRLRRWATPTRRSGCSPCAARSPRRWRWYRVEIREIPLRRGIKVLKAVSVHTLCFSSSSLPQLKKRQKKPSVRTAGSIQTPQSSSLQLLSCSRVESCSVTLATAMMLASRSVSTRATTRTTASVRSDGTRAPARPQHPPAQVGLPPHRGRLRRTEQRPLS